MIIGCCRGNWNLWWTSFSLVGLLFFPWPKLGLFSLGLRPRLNNWPPFGLGKKKSNLGKRSSSLVSFLYRPINVLETEYIFWQPFYDFWLIYHLFRTILIFSPIFYTHFDSLVTLMSIHGSVNLISDYCVLILEARKKKFCTKGAQKQDQYWHNRQPTLLKSFTGTILQLDTIFEH